MRKAAGIMLVIFGIYLIIVEAIYLSRIDSHLGAFTLLPIVFGAFIIAGGIFIVAGGILCIRKRYWGICLASTLLAVYIVIRWLINAHRILPWDWIAILGIPPIIFVCITKKEWQEISA